MDNNIRVPCWIGPTSCKNNINIAVISINGDITESLSESIIDVQAKGNYRWNLAVLRSCSLEEIVSQADVTGKLAIDFVIIAIDTSRLFCIEWAESVLINVNPDLRIRRVILVNASGLPIDSMAVNASEIITFCEKNRLDMFNANVLINEEARSVARKILKYIEVSLGIITGIPNLNI